MEFGIFSAIKKKTINKKQATIDMRAGLEVAIISLPVAIALAISSGVSPKVGIVSAIVGGIITSVFGGSPVQIGGPTGVFVVLSYGIVEKYGISGLSIAMLMGGCILIVMGLLRLGVLIKYMPYPITIGFTAGVAAILATSEVKNFFGLRIEKLPDGIIPEWTSYIHHAGTFNISAIIIGIISIIIILLWPKINKTIPGSLMAIIIMALVVKIFNIHIGTIGTEFGTISGSIPIPKIPLFGKVAISNLIIPAITIALLSAISSLLTAVISDDVLGQKHDPNTELIAQGLANIGTSFFGGIPSAGVVARTTANINGGARTPIGGITNGIVLFLIMVALMPLTKYIPLTALGAILLVVAYKMVKFKLIKKAFFESKEDFVVIIVTFVLTLVSNIVIAVFVGIILVYGLMIFKKIILKK